VQPDQPSCLDVTGRQQQRCIRAVTVDSAGETFSVTATFGHGGARSAMLGSQPTEWSLQDEFQAALYAIETFAWRSVYMVVMTVINRDEIGAPPPLVA
jgi:hypothetical protein